MKDMVLQRKKKTNSGQMWPEILSFNKNKYFIVLLLILLAVSGLIIPIIPGVLLFVLAIALLRKGWMSYLRRRFRLWKIKKTEDDETF